MAIFTDLTGKVIPHGAVQHRLEWTMTTDTGLPSWLTGAGTLTFNSITGGAGDRGSVRVQAAATANAVASITGPTITSSGTVRAIYWTVYGLAFSTFNTGVMDCQIGIDDADAGSTAGVYFRQIAATASAFNARSTLVRHPSGGSAVNPAIVDARYDMRTPLRRNLCVAMYPAWKTTALMNSRAHSSSVIYFNDNDATLVNGPVIPRLKIVNTSAGASSYFDFCGAELVIESS